MPPPLKYILSNFFFSRLLGLKIGNLISVVLKLPDSMISDW